MRLRLYKVSHGASNLRSLSGPPSLGRTWIRTGMIAARLAVPPGRLAWGVVRPGGFYVGSR